MNGRRVFERAKDEKGAESRARDLLENWNVSPAQAPRPFILEVSLRKNVRGDCESL